jgi:hypothetical protein
VLFAFRKLSDRKVILRHAPRVVFIEYTAAAAAAAAATVGLILIGFALTTLLDICPFPLPDGELTRRSYTAIGC